MSVVQDIGNGLSNVEVNITTTEGEELEVLLTNICKDLGKVSKIVENKGDIEFLLMIVGSYLIAKDTGTLDPEARPPKDLFDETLMPQIRNMSDIEAEIIEDDN